MKSALAAVDPSCADMRDPQRTLDGPDMADVLSSGSPEIDLDQVRDLVRQRYGISGEVTPLIGERDRNYKLQSDADGALFMLKCSHPAESALIADFQTRALLHIAAVDPGLPVQRIVPTLDGECSFAREFDGGCSRVVRLFTYLAGVPLPDAPRSAVQREHIARSWRGWTLRCRLSASRPAHFPCPGISSVPTAFARCFGTCPTAHAAPWHPVRSTGSSTS